MRIVGFNKATDPTKTDEVRINPAAVRYVEGSRGQQSGQTWIHLIGQGTVGIPVVEPIAAVVDKVGGLVTATRHYLAGQPETGGSLVHVAPSAISFIRPNSARDPSYWHIVFLDGTELRILDPLPGDL